MQRLQQLQSAGARLQRAATSLATTGNPQLEQRRALVEAASLARGLADKQLSRLPEVGHAMRNAYAGRMWLCLALARGTLPAWLALLSSSLAQEYAYFLSDPSLRVEKGE